jgi:type IV pilus assembly protein PilB
VAAPSEEQQLAALLVQRRVISRAQLDGAVADQQRTGRPLARVLIDSGAITESQLVAAITAQLDMEFVDLAVYPVDPTAVGVLSDTLARRYQALPVKWEDGVLVVAMADPANVLALDDIRAAARGPVRTVVATAAAIAAAIDKHHRLDHDVDDVTTLAADDVGQDDDLRAVTTAVEDGPIVKLANVLIRQAVQDRASDIHIEPTETEVRVRYRIDGVLHEVMRSPKRVQAGLVSRLKIMADLNIAERRIPQDGRVSTVISGRQIDLRVATLPTVYGEKVVMRILDKGTALLDLADLGFLPETMARYETVFAKPYGTILVTGPTGSGKSTTLYATLNQLNDPAKNIITVEDPVEYRLAGVNQVQVNNKAGMTFAAALRSILRSDPDIVLVGEIRDRETATIAMEAALTGHLVLSTLHTNDAASTPTRLIEMGIEPYLVASSVDCVVAQRLVRRLCDRCKVPHPVAAGELDGLGWGLADHERPEVVQRAAGCEACGRTGYHGRFALHEVLLVDDELSSMVAARAPSADLARVAVRSGMLTLRQAGMAHVRRGATSIEELLRVVS